MVCLTATAPRHLEGWLEVSPPVTKCNGNSLCCNTLRHRYRRFWRLLSSAAGAILYIHDGLSPLPAAKSFCA